MRERGKKMSNDFGSKLGLGTKLFNFEKFWTWLALTQILGVLTVFYPLKYPNKGKGNRFL